MCPAVRPKRNIQTTSTRAAPANSSIDRWDGGEDAPVQAGSVVVFLRVQTQIKGTRGDFDEKAPSLWEAARHVWLGSENIKADYYLSFQGPEREASRQS